MVTETAVAETVTSVIEAIHPFCADDGHKGTFLILKIAGLEQSTALRLIHRKYRSWQNWRATDEDFRRIDEQVPALSQRFGGEARVVRTALLDISVVETGIMIFKRILSRQPVTEGMFAYAVKMAGLRVPMMGAKAESGSPWERLANSIKQTLAQSLGQREMTLIQAPDGTQSITAKETIVEPSAEQRQVANDIVQNMIDKAREG